MASYLASVKRRVAVLLRSSRASDEKFDDLYREARQKGVTFIRYESADVAEEEGIYTINAFDGKLSVSLETSLCVDCAELLDPELEAMIDFLKIRRYGDGCISGNRWFLTQGATFKRNVRFINTAALGTDVLKIVPSLVSDLCALSEPGQTKTAYVDPKKCAFCYTCYRVCPHSALMPDDEAKAMKVNELLCSACGICVSVCPAAAISFKGEAARDVSSEKTRKLKVFCCENSAYIASKEAFAGMDVAIEPISCGGEVSAALMTQTLKEYDNVLVAVCCDDACKHRDGNKRLIKQVERLKDRLEKLGYDPGRVSCVQTGVTMVNMLKDAAEKALSGGGEK
jgi:ferredoxin